MTVSQRRTLVVVACQEEGDGDAATDDGEAHPDLATG